MGVQEEMTREDRFKQKWLNRRFKCNTTGEVFEIPDSVYETAFYAWGEAYIDVGRLNMYSRFSNCTEITEDKE